MLSQASVVSVSVKKGTHKADGGPRGGQCQLSERLAVNFPSSCIANARQVPKAASSRPQEGWLGSGHPRGSCVLPLTSDVLPHGYLPGDCPFHSEPAGSAQSARGKGRCGNYKLQLRLCRQLKGSSFVFHSSCLSKFQGCLILSFGLTSYLPRRHLKCHVPQGTAGGWRASQELLLLPTAQ